MSSLSNDCKKLRTEFPYSNVESLKNIPKNSNIPESALLEELGKLARLIKSNVTKLGIISVPHRISNNEEAFRKQIGDLMKVIFYLLSLVPSFHDSCFADYFVDKLDHEVATLIQSVHKLSDELEEIVKMDADEFKDIDLPDEEKLNKFLQERLISIGMLWSQSDNLEALSSQGNKGLLEQYISSSITLLQDSIEEIEEWLENPVINSDPFRIDDGFSDEEGFNSEEEDEDAPESMKTYVKIMLQKDKLLKLLLGSLSKSVDIKKDTITTAASLSELNKLHNDIVTNSDLLISSVLMSSEYDSDPEVENAKLAIDNGVKKIIKIVTRLNASNESKTKWIKVWSDKWNSLD